MVRQKLDGRLRDKNVKTSLNGVERDWIMCTCAMLNKWRIQNFENYELSGVKTMTASPGDNLSMAALSERN